MRDEMSPDSGRAADDPADVRIERRPDGIAVLTLDRPRRKNALDDRMWFGLGSAADALERETPRVLVVHGAGGAFCAGMDVNPANPLIGRFLEALESGSVEAVREHLGLARGIFDRLAALPCPKVAAIEGAAFGGGAELALCCDLRVAAESARIAFSEARLGLMADVGGSVRLTRLVGPARAADLLLTTRVVPPPEALAMGLVNRLAAEGGALDAALALAAEIAASGPLAVRAALRVVRATAAGESDAVAFERELDEASRLIVAGEVLEGVAAFMEKRKPRWSDAG